MHTTLLDVFLAVYLKTKKTNKFLFLMGTEEVYDIVVADSLQKNFVSGMFVTWKCEGVHYGTSMNGVTAACLSVK